MHPGAVDHDIEGNKQSPSEANEGSEEAKVVTGVLGTHTPASISPLHCCQRNGTDVPQTGIL